MDRRALRPSVEETARLVDLLDECEGCVHGPPGRRLVPALVTMLLSERAVRQHAARPMRGCRTARRSPARGVDA